MKQRGKILSPFEVGRVLGMVEILKKENVVYSDLAKKVNADWRTVKKIIDNPSSYGISKSPGRPKKIAQRQHSILKRTVNNSNGWTSAAHIASDANLKVNPRTIQRKLNDLGFKVMKANRLPPIKDNHRLQRIQFAQEYLTKAKKFWDKIIFSDEKKWRLDGPDGYDKYWHQPGTVPQTKIKRQSGGGGVMVWLGLWSKGTTPVVYCSDHMDKDEYLDVLKNHLLPQLKGRRRATWHYQQDNAPIHKAKDVMNFFTSKKINVVVWPARSPDLNPVENLWGYLTHQLFSNGKQYSSVDDLKSALEIAVKNIPQTLLYKLCHGMPDRLKKVLDNNGDHIGM